VTTKRKPASRHLTHAKRARAKPAAERIRESARDLFYRRGIRAVGVDEIVSNAGVTKPSLYRAFPSKDELAADYLRHMGEDGLSRFDSTIMANSHDPRGQFRIWLLDLLERATKSDYRGCGTSNAAVEYPDRKHPARKVAANIKTRFRRKLVALARAMGARRPEVLGDALMLLLEGVYMSCQLFGATGPSRAAVETADMLIDAHLKR
jgi:AcrR family transcriptional regulator